jgi:hypothetical protein
LAKRTVRNPVDPPTSPITRLSWSGVAATACLAGMPVVAEANPSFTLPIGLAPGQHYRIIFLTSGTTEATSTSLSTYNTFVTGQAALNSALPSTSWDAVASSSTTSALTNIACSPSCSSDPIYLVTGTQVAANTSGLFSGSLMTAIDVTQSGASESGTPQFEAYAWTGSNSNGSIDTGSAMGASDPEFGFYVDTDGTAIAEGSYQFQTGTEPMYAISGDLVVPTPAPGGLGLYALGGLLTYAARKFRRRAPATA